MATPKGSITPSFPVPTTRTVYDRAPKPKKPHTPRREYAFMRNYAVIWSQPGGPFGPFNGGEAR